MADEIIIDELLVSTETLSHFKVKQDLENESKFKKKDDATDLKGAVRYDAAQVLSEQEKAQARANIGAAAPGEGGGGSAEGAVLYTEQALTAEQKSQARANIGATDGTWESMPDKPFGKTGFNIKWVVNDTQGKETHTIEGVATFFKISNEPIPYNELLGATVKSDSEGICPNGEIVISEDNFVSLSIGTALVVVYPLVMSISSTDEDSSMGVAVSFPSTGTWVFAAEDSDYFVSIEKDYEVKKIDKEFLPDDITFDLPENVVQTDGNGLIPTSMLPSYVDDVIEGYYNAEDNLFYKEAEFTTAITGETGKIYTDLASRDIYRWSGSVFVQINPKTYRLATNDDIDALFSK